MKPVRTVRRSLHDIQGALVDTPPEPSYRGDDPGVEVTALTQGWQETEALCYDGGLACPNWSENSDDGEGDEQGVPEFSPVIEIGSAADESIPALNGEEMERIRKSVELYGVDALGWYSSFHVIGTQWGVYIPVSGIVYVMEDVLGSLPTGTWTKAHLAFHAILNHELFHFAADYAVAQAELVFEEPWWAPAKRAFGYGTPGYCAQEEKLANAYMLKAFRTMKPALRVKGKQQVLRDFTLAQPTGYCEGDWVRREGWERNLAVLGGCYRNYTDYGNDNPHLGPDNAFDWPQLFPVRPRIDWRHCPIHLIHDGARLGIPEGWLNLFCRLQTIDESDAFVKQYRRQPPAVQKSWQKTKRVLGTDIPAGADFKKWPKGGGDVWSVRVNQSYRAHLRHEASESWTALSIGNHKQMGHG